MLKVLHVSASVLALTCAGPVAAQSAVGDGSSAVPQTPPAADAAQSDPVEAGTGNEEIVVTAERRTTSLARTGVAATVLSGAELTARGVVDVNDLQFAAPSLTVQNSGQGNQFNIRGIGKAVTTAGVDVGVITYRDGVATFPGYFQTEPYYDIASVEVLRGPQGTFAGQNATGGAVFINEVNPSFDGVHGYAQGLVGNYGNYGTQGAVNLPVSDTLAFRFATNNEYRDSFYDVSGDHAGNPGRLRSNSVRGSMLWEPADNLRILLRGNYHHIDMGGIPAEPVNDPGDPFDVSNNSDINAFLDEFGRVVLHVDYTFGNGMKLRTVSGYQEGTTTAAGDLDGRAAAGAAAASVYKFVGKERIFSQEVNLLSADDGPFTWLIGGYYQHDRTSYPQGDFFTRSFQPLINAFALTTLEGKTDKTSAAAFAQVAYEPVDGLKVQLGGRVTRATTRNEGLSQLTTLSGIPLLRSEQRDFNANTLWTGKAALNWTVNPRHFLYAFVATGAKTGGINAPDALNPARVPPAFVPERVTDFEVGWKGNFLGGRVRTDVGAFYNLYKNFQLSIPDPFTPAITNIFNAPSTTDVAGVEASIQANFGALSIDSAVSYLHTEVGRFFAADPRLPRAGSCDASDGPQTASCVDLTGNRIPFAPEMTMRVGAQYAFDLGRDISLTPRADFSHLDATWNTIFQNRALFDRLGERNIVNAQLTLAGKNWSAALFSRNLGNQEYITSINGRQQRLMGSPRQYGLRLTTNF